MFEDLSLVTRTMGCPVKISGRNYVIFQYSEITAMYHEVSDFWITDQSNGGLGRATLKQVLSVFVNGSWEDPNALHVCYLERGDGAYARYQPRFIPGNWSNTLLEFLAGAIEVGRAAGKRKAEAERAALLRELLIGITV
jgi:hypothetical protein